MNWQGVAYQPERVHVVLHDTRTRKDWPEIVMGPPIVLIEERMYARDLARYGVGRRKIGRRIRQQRRRARRAFRVESRHES